MKIVFSEDNTFLNFFLPLSATNSWTPPRAVPLSPCAVGSLSTFARLGLACDMPGVSGTFVGDSFTFGVTVQTGVER